MKERGTSGRGRDKRKERRGIEGNSELFPSGKQNEKEKRWKWKERKKK